MASIAMLLIVLAQTPAAPPAPEPGRHSGSLAEAALGVLASKCVQCHGPEVPHPKAMFGYVTDLRRLVESGKYIVPGKPEDSEIWKQIADDDMPPDGAKAGPLNQSEKDAILAWITAGATTRDDAESMPIVARPARDQPADRPVDRESTARSVLSPAPAGQPPSATSAGGSFVRRGVLLLGRAHVIVVHFPIALLVSGSLAELGTFVRGRPSAAPLTRFCLWGGALAAVLAAGLGWIHALDGFPGPLASPITIAGLHRWLGTGVALAAPAVALAAERDLRRATRSTRVRWAIIGLGAFVGAAAHFGGLLTHGSEFFTP